MEDVLKYTDNFAKTESVKSVLKYGAMLDDPDFTICIPVYGLGKYFNDVLKNLMEQEETKLQIQILISDNKVYTGVNPFMDILQQYGSMNIAYFCAESEIGQLNNFNRCVLLAKSKYVSMLHDDDLLVTNYYKLVERTIPFLEKNPDIGIVRGNYEMFYGKVKIKRSESVSLHEITSAQITHIGLTHTGIPSCGIILNRELFLKYGGYNDRYPSSGDAFLGGIMIENGCRLFEFDTATGYYRIGVNTSIKTESCKGFIMEDEMFRDTWASRNKIRKGYMSLLKRYIYSQNINAKVENFGKMNPQITISELDYKNEYKKYNKFSITRILYGIISRLIRLYCHITKVKLLEA